MFEGAVADARASELRIGVCREVGGGLSEVGRTLWVGGYLLGPDRVEGVSPFGFGDDAAVGLATVSQIGGELVKGAVALFEQDIAYAAAALLRQLVEVEYLAWAFVEDRDEAAAWLRSTRETRHEMWQPRHLRKRSTGRFRATDYAHHCECGGHPTPAAKRLLPDHSQRDHVGLWWFDLAVHSSSVWRYVCSAISEFGWSVMVEPRDISELIEEWWRVDPVRPLLGRAG